MALQQGGINGTFLNKNIKRTGKIMGYQPTYSISQKVKSLSWGFPVTSNLSKTHTQDYHLASVWVVWH